MRFAAGLAIFIFECQPDLVGANREHSAEDFRQYIGTLGTLPVGIIAGRQHGDHVSLSVCSDDNRRTQPTYHASERRAQRHAHGYARFDEGHGK